MILSPPRRSARWPLALLSLIAACGGEPADPAPGLDAMPTTDGGSAALCGCFAGDGTYCAARVAAYAGTAGCALPDLAAANPDAVLRCAAGAWTVEERCTAGCSEAESANADACGLPLCDCFVKVGWCGASAARQGLTLDTPCRVPLSPEHDDDLLACDANGAWIVKEACAKGCYQAPTGTPDYCLSDRTPQDPGWAPCAKQPLLASGLHPEASDRLRCAGVTADRITQTIGDAAASAGYHAADGTVDGKAYCAALDLRARDRTEAQLRALLQKLGDNGFAAWYRKPGYDGWPADQAPHIHAVFAGVPMKTQLRGQVRDYLIGLNGLASHTPYEFFQPGDATLQIVRLLFSRNYTPP